MENINSHEVYNTESLFYINKLQEHLFCKIKNYSEKTNYNWLVPIFQYALEMANRIEAHTIQELREKQEAYGKGYQAGYKACEKDHGVVPNKYYDKEAYRAYSISKLKEDMPQLF